MKLIDRRTALALLAGLPAGIAVAAPAEAAASVPLSYDNAGRPTALVSINGKGPFTLVVDSAAGGTALTGPLVAELGLAADANAHVAVRGAGGTSATQLFTLESLKIGDLEVRPAQATLLPHGGISDSGGVLGADTFVRGRVEFDFAAGRLRASNSPGMVPSGFTVIAAQLRNRVLPVVPARFGAIEALALIDTGARATIANVQLMGALGYAPGDSRLTVEERPVGATGHVMRSYLGGVGDLAFGGQTFAGQKLVFSDLPVFQALGMGDRPGVIVGIDTLRRLDAVAIDYPRGEVQLRPRR